MFGFIRRTIVAIREFITKPVSDLSENMSAGFAAVSSAILMLQSCMVAAPLSIWPTMLKENDSVNIHVFIKGSQIWELRAFGLEAVFDPQIFSLVDVTFGALNANWSMEDQNEVEPGRVRIAQICGAAPAIVGKVSGSITIVRLALQDPGFTGDFTISLEAYVDDLKVMSPEPSVKTFKIE